MLKSKLKEYKREWYLRNRESEIKKAKIRTKTRKKELYAWYVSIKSKLHCEICKENHIACLEFHHKNPKDKKFELSSAAHQGFSKEKILKEMKKCKILCSNCHRKLHYKK